MKILFILRGEVNEGERLKKNYEIFLVRNLSNPESIVIECIRGPFDYKKDESFNSNKRFLVTNDNFILKFAKDID